MNSNQEGWFENDLNPSEHGTSPNTQQSPQRVVPKPPAVTPDPQQILTETSTEDHSGK